jgi:hypothetical protein
MLKVKNAESRLCPKNVEVKNAEKSKRQNFLENVEFIRDPFLTLGVNSLLLRRMEGQTENFAPRVKL